MYRTYECPKNEPYVISMWDGDCYSYTVCESKEEYEQEKQRLAKIEEEYNKAKQDYLKNCQDY